MACYIYERDLRLCQSNPGFREVAADLFVALKACSSRDTLLDRDDDGGHVMFPIGFTGEYAIIYDPQKGERERRRVPRSLKNKMIVEEGFYSFQGVKDFSGQTAEACDVWGR